MHPPSPTFSDHSGPINVLPHWTHFVESTGVLAGSNVLLFVFGISDSPLEEPRWTLSTSLTLSRCSRASSRSHRRKSEAPQQGLPSTQLKIKEPTCTEIIDVDQDRQRGHIAG
jgi:hypothetical protein